MVAEVVVGSCVVGSEQQEGGNRRGWWWVVVVVVVGTVLHRDRVADRCKGRGKESKVEMVEGRVMVGVRSVDLQ